MFALNRILVPTNLGEPSKAAIRYGVAFARQFDAELYIVHVLSKEDFESAIETERVIEELLPETAPPEPAKDADTRQSLARNAAREELAELLDANDAQAAQVEYIIRPAESGKPGDSIIACAGELDVELVIMGKHRMGFVEHLFAGSVTENVIRHAPCPVLIVQHPEHDFVVPDEREN
ncbi:MAG: universal stress protein [Gammaproteobacteria bacterium]